MKGEFFKNATQNFNHGNFECNYSVAMDGIQDFLSKMHSFHNKHHRACRRDIMILYWTNNFKKKMFETQEI